MKVRKAIIPAAGLGTRFLPATKAQPRSAAVNPLYSILLKKQLIPVLRSFLLLQGETRDRLRIILTVPWSWKRLCKKATMQICSNWLMIFPTWWIFTT